MSILKQQKVTLIGQVKDKNALLESLQTAGCMHVLNLSEHSKAEQGERTHKQSEDAFKALRFLTEVDKKRRQILELESFDVQSLVDKCLDLQVQLRRQEDKRLFLEQRIRQLEPWGNIEYPSPDWLNGYRFWYFQIPVNKTYWLKHVTLPWQIVGKDHRFAYTVLISKEEPVSDILPVERIHLGSVSKLQLLDDLESTELEIDNLQAKRFGLTRFIHLLSLNIARAVDQQLLNETSNQVFCDEHLVIIQGWVATENLPNLMQLTDQLKLVRTIEDPSKGELPPTQISQPESLEAAKDLALFYQVPGYEGWDPSKVIFASFAIFFAMILADAGYGLLMATGLLLYWKKLGQSAKGRAYRLLGLALTGTTILYGAFVGSYFGVTPPEHSILGYFQILDLNDFDVMMKLSIIVGALHLGIANVSMAVVNRHRPFALSKVGWLLAIYGALGYWLVGEHQTGQTISAAIAAVGVIFIVLFSSERPLNKASDIFWRLLDGLFSLKNALNAFGDVLSYMRLFALGLASASLAITFNKLAMDTYQAVSGGGFLLAGLILLIGHLLNILLSVMSGVVHGLRLNYIEFFNWGQAEEGTAFNAFARTETKNERK